MPVPPEEILGKRFLVTMRGYDRAEVDAYLRTLAAEQTRLLGRIQRLEEELSAAGGAAKRSEADEELTEVLGLAAERMGRRRFSFRRRGEGP